MRYALQRHTNKLAHARARACQFNSVRLDKMMTRWGHSNRIWNEHEKICIRTKILNDSQWVERAKEAWPIVVHILLSFLNAEQEDKLRKWNQIQLYLLYPFFRWQKTTFTRECSLVLRWLQRQSSTLCITPNSSRQWVTKRKLDKFKCNRGQGDWLEQTIADILVTFWWHSER